MIIILAPVCRTFPVFQDCNIGFTKCQTTVIIDPSWHGFPEHFLYVPSTESKAPVKLDFFKAVLQLGCARTAMTAFWQQVAIALLWLWNHFLPVHLHFPGHKISNDLSRGSKIHAFSGCLLDGLAMWLALSQCLLHFVTCVGKRTWDSCVLEEPEASLISQKNLFRKDLAFNLFCPVSDSGAMSSLVVWWKCKKLVEILHNYALFHNIKSTFNQGLWGIIQRIFLKPIVVAVCSELRYACSIVFFCFFKSLHLKKTKTFQQLKTGRKETKRLL